MYQHKGKTYLIWWSTSELCEKGSVTEGSYLI